MKTEITNPKMWPNCDAAQDESLVDTLNRCAHHAKIGTDISIFLDIFDKIKATEIVTPSQCDTLADRLKLDFIQTFNEDPYAYSDGRKISTREELHNLLPNGSEEDIRMTADNFKYLFDIATISQVYHRDYLEHGYRSMAYSSMSQYEDIIRELYKFLSMTPQSRKGFGILIPDNDMPAHLIDYDHLGTWVSDWVILDPMDFLSYNYESNSFMPNYYAVEQFCICYSENHKKPYSETGEFYGYRFDPKVKSYSVVVSEETYKFAVKRSRELIEKRRMNSGFDVEQETELSLLLDIERNYRCDHEKEKEDSNS